MNTKDISANWSFGYNADGLRISRAIGTFNYTDGSSSDPFIAQFNPDMDSSVNWQYSAQMMVVTKDYSSVTVTLAYDYNANTACFDGIQLYREEFGHSYAYDDKGNVTSVKDLQKSTALERTPKRICH